jgi:ribosomal protein L39E
MHQNNNYCTAAAEYQLKFDSLTWKQQKLLVMKWMRLSLTKSLDSNTTFPSLMMLQVQKEVTRSINRRSWEQHLMVEKLLQTSSRA